MEYVRLSNSESTYSQKNLLQVELILLISKKALQEYKELRKQEFMFKIEVKSRIEETLTKLRDLEKLLPKSSYKIRTENKTHPIIRKIDSKSMFIQQVPEKDELESELNAIREKLLRIQR